MFDGLGGGDIGRKETTKRKIKGIDDALERILGFQYFRFQWAKPTKLSDGSNEIKSPNRILIWWLTWQKQMMLLVDF